MIPYRTLAKCATEVPDRLAFVDADGGGTFTFGELWDRVQRIAAGLQELGIGKGDVVGALLPNCIELVELYIACGRLGAIFQPMDVRFRRVELQNCLTNTTVQVLFVWAPFIDQNIEAFLPKETKKVAVRETREGWIDYSQFLQKSPFTGGEPSIDEEEDLALYLYTSGSTSAIKCVPVTWRQLDFFPQDLVSIWSINA